MSDVCTVLERFECRENDPSPWTSPLLHILDIEDTTEKIFKK